MDKKATDIIAYLTWVGLIIALVAGDRENSKFHLNQSLVIWLAGTICGFIAVIPLLGTLVTIVGEIFCFICWFIGIVGALQGNEKPVPFLGQFQLLK